MTQNNDGLRPDAGGANLSRRTVVTGVAAGVAWAVPAVSQAAAAPALIASKNCTYTTNEWTYPLWADYPLPARTTGNNNLAKAGNITATSVLNGSTGTTIAMWNMYLMPLSLTNYYNGKNWLQLSTCKQNQQGMTVTFTFPQPVYCVSFYVNDIDTQYVSGSSMYRDKVVVDSGFTASAATATGATYLTCSGGSAIAKNTATSSTSSTYAWDYATSTNGLVQFKANGPISSFTLTYTNENCGTGTTVISNNQQVYISPIKYATSDCNCL